MAIDRHECDVASPPFATIIFASWNRGMAMAKDFLSSDHQD